MKKLIFLVFLIPSLSFADRLGSLRSDAQVLLTTQSASGAVPGPNTSIPFVNSTGTFSTNSNLKFDPTGDGSFVLPVGQLDIGAGSGVNIQSSGGDTFLGSSVSGETDVQGLILNINTTSGTTTLQNSTFGPNTLNITPLPGSGTSINITGATSISNAAGSVNIAGNGGGAGNAGDVTLTGGPGGGNRGGNIAIIGGTAGSSGHTAAGNVSINPGGGQFDNTTAGNVYISTINPSTIYLSSRVVISHANQAELDIRSGTPSGGGWIQTPPVINLGGTTGAPTVSLDGLSGLTFSSSNGGSPISGVTNLGFINGNSIDDANTVSAFTIHLPTAAPTSDGQSLTGNTNGNTIWKNVSGGSGGSGVTVYPATATIIASFGAQISNNSVIGTTNPFVTLMRSTEPWISVRDCGAYGLTSDTEDVKIQRCINIATATSKNLYFPAGTYNLMNELVYKQTSITWFGDGAGVSILNQMVSTNNVVHVTDTGGLNNVTMRDFTLRGTGRTKSTKSCLLIDTSAGASDNWLLQNLSIETSSFGVKATDLDNSQFINDAFVTDQTSIYVDGISNSNSMIGCTYTAVDAGGLTAIGMDIESGRGWVIANGDFGGPQMLTGVKFRGDELKWFGSNCEVYSTTDNFVDLNFPSISGTQKVSIEGVTFTNSAGQTAYPINVDSVQLTINNNLFLYFAASGAPIRTTTNSHLINAGATAPLFDVYTSSVGGVFRGTLVSGPWYNQYGNDGFVGGATTRNSLRTRFWDGTADDQLFWNSLSRNNVYNLDDLNQYNEDVRNNSVSVGDPVRIGVSTGTNMKLVGNSTSTSYANFLGSGDRRSYITITTTISVAGGVISNWINGNEAGQDTGNSFFWTGETIQGKTIKFDFGFSKVITEVKFFNDRVDSQGVWRWSGSVDDVTYSNLGSTFTWGDVVTKVDTSLSTNTTAYRYYKMTGVSGSVTNVPWVFEIEFAIDEMIQKNSQIQSYTGANVAGGALLLQPLAGDTWIGNDNNTSTTVIRGRLQSNTTYWAISPTGDASFTSSLTIPNGTNPTVTSVGRMAVDTSSGQIVAHNGTDIVVLPSTFSKTLVFENPVVGDFPIGWRTSADVTITSLVCVSSAATSTTVNILDCSPSDGTSCNTLWSGAVCGTTEFVVGISSTVAVDRRVRTKVTATSGTPGWLGVDVYYRENRK